jgi:hypothetical protein
MKPPDADISSMAKDSLISATLGGAAMVARMLLSDEPLSLGWIVRRGCAAMITASIVGLVAQDYIQSKGALYASIGAAGAVAPEIMEYLIKYVRARGDKEISHATRKQTNRKRRK